ncbi:MAG TPA: TIGR02281 family clan AA aspartic protease [Gammaproteobacteria bacterium]|nr:TIGR02281 family clan AA aspartic protease [Gammaproteobacteria bacterium]
MRKITVGLLIFTAGWGLGWYTHQAAGPVVSSRPVVPVLPNNAEPEAPAAPGRVDDLAGLLQRHEFEAALERYETLQLQAGEVAVAEARAKILAHARRLIAARDFSPAEQLLQLFLVAAYRDVEARILLASAYRGQEDLYAAIDQLYEAGGYAYRPATLQRITGRIRSIVAELARSLAHSNDQNALLALYQHLTRMEPGHAAWFMGLATAQLALDDREAARRSLLLVAQDPDVGAQAQAMLAELSPALPERQDTASPLAVTEVTGIPLQRSGNHFIVDARPAEAHSLRLLIDTGASLTILTPAALEQRGIRYQNTGRSRIFNTANGPVRAPVYRLDALSVGDWQVNQLEIGVLELGGSGIDGLLGMNFLSHFQFFIDQNKALLRLAP